MQQVGSAVHQGITTEGKARLQETPTAHPVLIETEAEVHPKAEVHPERIVAGSNKAELEVHQEKIAEEQQQVEAGALRGTTEVARLLAAPGAQHGMITVESLHSKVHRGTTEEGRLQVEAEVHQGTTAVGLQLVIEAGAHHGTTAGSHHQLEVGAHQGTIIVDSITAEVHQETTVDLQWVTEAEAHHGTTTGVAHLLAEDIAHQGMTREMIIEVSHRL